MATVKEHGISNVADRVVETAFSDGTIELTALLLEKLGGVIKVRQGDTERMNGRIIRMTVDEDADLDSDDTDTEVTVELV